MAWKKKIICPWVNTLAFVCKWNFMQIMPNEITMDVALFTKLMSDVFPCVRIRPLMFWSHIKHKGSVFSELICTWKQDSVYISGPIDVSGCVPEYMLLFTFESAQGYLSRCVSYWKKFRAYNDILMHGQFTFSVPDMLAEVCFHSQLSISGSGQKDCVL